MNIRALVAAVSAALLVACARSHASAPPFIAPSPAFPPAQASRTRLLPRGALYRLGVPAPSRDSDAWRYADRASPPLPEREVPKRRWAPDDEPLRATATPDGARIAASYDGGSVALWSGAPRRERTLVGHVRDVESLSFSPNGASLVTASSDGEVRVWRTSDGTERFVLSMRGGDTLASEPVEIRFSADGRSLLVAGLARVRRWSLGDGRELDADAAHLDGIERVAVSPRGWAASCDGGSVVYRWDLASGARELLTGHESNVTDLAVSPDGSLLATTALDHGVRFWGDGRAPSRLANGRHYSGALCADFDPRGSVLMVGDAWGQARSWVTADGALWNWFRLHHESEDWHDYGVDDLAWSPDGSMLATTGADGYVAVWLSTALDDEEPLAKRAMQDACDIAWTPDGTSLLVRHGPEGHLAFLAADDLATQSESTAVGWRSAALAPDGDVVAACAASGELVVLARADLSERARAPADALVVAWAPDAQRLLTGGEDGTLLVWDVATLLGAPPAAAIPRTAAVDEPPPGDAPERPVAQVSGLADGECVRAYEGELPGAEPVGVKAVLVLDGRSGRPLVGAEVSVFGEPGRGYRDEPFTSGTTDAHGLTAVLSASREQWVVRRNGFAPQSLLTTGPDGPVVLFPGAGARARVVDPFGDPLVDADVQLFLGCGHSPAVHRARTDSEGRFAFPDAEPRARGMLWLVGRGIASEYVGHEVLWAAGLREPTIVTKPGVDIRGVVTNADGSPCSGWYVASEEPYRGPVVATAPDGSFELPTFDPEEELLLESPGGRMHGTLRQPLAHAPALLRIVAPTHGDESVEGQSMRRAVPFPVRVVDARGAAVRSGVRLVHTVTGFVFAGDPLAEPVDGATSIVHAPEGRYVLLVGGPFTPYAAEPVEVDVHRDAEAAFVVAAQAQPTLDVELPVDAPEVAMRLVVDGAALDVSDSGDAPFHLPRSARAALQVWHEKRSQVNESVSLMRVFEVGPERGGRRGVRVDWPRPHLVRLTGLGDVDAVEAEAGPVAIDGRLVAATDGRAFVFRTYAEGTLRLTLRDRDGRVARAEVELDGDPDVDLIRRVEWTPAERAELALRLPLGTPAARVVVWDGGSNLGPGSAWTAKLDGEPVILLDPDVRPPALAQLDVRGWAPRSVAITAPERRDVTWGDATLVLDVTTSRGERPEVVVVMDGCTVTRRDGRVELRGIDAGKLTILVGAKDCVPQVIDLDVSPGAVRLLEIALPTR